MVVELEGWGQVQIAMTVFMGSLVGQQVYLDKFKSRDDGTARRTCVEGMEALNDSVSSLDRTHVRRVCRLSDELRGTSISNHEGIRALVCLAIILLGTSNSNHEGIHGLVGWATSLLRTIKK